MLTLSIILVIIGLLFWNTRKPSYLPPGKWGLPVLGYCPFLTQEFGDIVKNLHNKFGDIFTWKLGSRVMVFLNEANLIKTTLNKPECQGRPYFYTMDIMCYHMNTGLILSRDNVWKDGRRFALHQLKDFGMGKSTMDEIIQHEAQVLVKSYSEQIGNPVEISWSVNVAALNVIWKLVADHRYDIDDEEIIYFSKLTLEETDTIQGAAALLDLFPGIHNYLPGFVLNWLGIQELYANMDVYTEFVMKIINKHKETLDPNNPRDYIDSYLIETEKQRGDDTSIFKDDYKNLVITIGDLFTAGSETTSSTLQWTVLLLARHPEIQEKMQKEIDEVIPRDRVPSLTDKNKLPYTEAVLLEVQRFASLVPLGMFHSTTEDVTVDKYFLPKGTAVIANASACHRDPRYWEKPDQFYPEHFIDNEGKTMNKKEGFLPFSLGRRQCLGENLAKMELFLFATSLFKAFSITAAEGETLSTEMDASAFLLNRVKPFKVVMAER